MVVDLKQVIAIAGKVEVEEVPKPVCEDNGILVRTEFSVISTGTETWTIDSTEPVSASDLVRDSSKLTKAIDLSKKIIREEGFGGFGDYFDYVRHPKFPVGYSSAGTVIQVGRKVNDLSVGDRVACAGEGKACHAEIVSVPRNLAAKIPEGVGSRDAAFSTIGAIALHAFRQSRAQLGECVAVIGVGLVGNLVVQILRSSGCVVAALDLKENRLSLAKSLGADLTMRSDDPSLMQHASHFTGGRFFDVVILCAATTSSEPINLAAKLLRSRGRLVILGRVGMNIERKDFYQKELELVMSRSLGPGRYDVGYEEKGIDYPLDYVRWTLNRNMEGFMGLVQKKRVEVTPLVGGEYSLEKAAEAYASLEGQQSVAVVLNYPHSNDAVVSQTAEVRGPSLAALPLVSGKVKLALVGPGSFAKDVLIPLLRRSEDYSLRWVVSSSPVNAGKVADRYKFEKHTCDYTEVLKDPQTDLVLISAPNHLHFPMAMQAMRAGKPVFVEKPLCLTREELTQMQRLQKETGVPVFVGFNRRYAPQVLKMKEYMERLDGPFLIDFRANVGFTAASRWVQDPEVGGGRIIAEGCHFFDLFNFLLDQSSPSEILASSASVNGSTSVAKDNVVATLKYKDGSVANLVYVSLGNKSMERERLEVFAQGVSLVLEDFKKLTVYGLDQKMKPLVMNLSSQDKGWKSEFREVAKLLRGEKNSMITFSECVDSTALTLSVDEALRKPNTD